MVPFHLRYTSCNLSYFLPSINNLSNLNFFVFYICNFEYSDNIGLSFVNRIIRSEITIIIRIVTKKDLACALSMVILEHSILLQIVKIAQ